MGKMSVSFLARLALIFTVISVISTYRYLECSQSKAGDIFIRSMTSMYMCKDRREEHIGCIYSKNPTNDALYGYDTTFLYAQINYSETANLFNVGKRNLPNCCALRSNESDTHLRQYQRAQSTLSNILRIAKGQDRNFTDRVRSFQKLSEDDDIASPYDSICQMDSNADKKIYATHHSKLYKCVGNAFEEQAVCPVAINGSSAIRCATKDDVYALYPGDFGEIDVTHPDFCCHLNGIVVNPDEDEELLKKLKPCNVLAP